MAMGNRPEVKTAPRADRGAWTCLCWPVISPPRWRGCRSAIPSAGESSPLSNLGITVTREVIRAFMGYSSSLRIPEFRSLELVLDDICKRIMPPIVRSLDVEGRAAEFGGVPGILYVPRHRTPEGVVLYLHGGGYIGTSPNMYAFFTAQVCRPNRLRRLRRRLPTGPRVPLPRRRRGCLGHLHGTARARASRANASSWPATQVAAGWPTPCCSRTPRPSIPSVPLVCCSSRPRSISVSTRTPSPRTPTTTSCRGTSRRRPTCMAWT